VALKVLDKFSKFKFYYVVFSGSLSAVCVRTGAEGL